MSPSRGAVGRQRADSPAGAPELADELLIDAEADEAVAPSPTALAHPLWIVVGLVFVAFNLRPALSSLAPVLPEIRTETGLTATLAGVLTTAPVLCLGLFGPLGPRLSRRFGAETIILAFLVVLAGGLVLRGVGTVPALFAGSVLAGAGIGVIGVLLPGIVKRDFPHQAGLMTGIYTMVLCTGAAFGAGATVPLEHALGESWRIALMAWGMPALVAAVVWAPQARVARPRHAAAASDMRGLWRDPLAWRVTGYMGLQSSLAYIVFGWLPVALQDRGLDPLSAGLIASGSVVAQTVTALVVPVLAARNRSQRVHMVVMVAAAVVGFVGALLGPLSLLWGFAVLLGLGLGGCFALGLTLIVLRARDAHVAAHLSGMAQSVGYCVASLGPFAVGLARQWSGGWAVPAAVYTCLAGAALLSGWRAAREGFVLADRAGV